MAVAAYAAVVSLMHVLDQIQQYPSGHRLHLDRDRIATLCKKVSILQDFLEVHSQRVEGLARQIAAVAHEAEDVIDSHVVDQLRKGSTDKSDMDLSLACEGIDDDVIEKIDLIKKEWMMIEKIDLIKKELMMIKEGTNIQEQEPKVSHPARSSAPPSIGDNTVVGFDERLDRIRNDLKGDERDLQVLPIVGMGGIGKTTLARTAFDDQHMVQHFDIRIWVTISQDYSMKKIVSGLLSGKEIGDQKYKENDESLAELGDRLYNKLYDRRYLIVMDDVWSAEIWKEYSTSFFPNNSNRSRIMVTTRLTNVAVSFSSRNPYLMDFLDDDQSWNLFCIKAFAKKDGCPPELEKVGKSIAKSCQGLPLAIVVIGGLLSKSNMTRKYWEFVAKDVNSFANSGDDEHCRKILSLSYNHLPIHLKLCFLYLRVFPEDHRINISKLIKLWVVEGFLKPIRGKTLEEVAQEYLKDLIGRNLILMRGGRINGEIRTCSMHDLLRDLCIRESQKEQFYCVPKVQNIDLANYGTTCFLCASEDTCTRIDLPRVVVASQPASPASCLVCDTCRIMYPQLNRLRLVKVLEDPDNSDAGILHPTKLRYLSVRGYFQFAGNSIHLLWNVWTLITNCRRDSLHLPSEIWELPQLRHLVSTNRSVLLDPPLNTRVDRKDSTIILKNLQTLSSVENFRWSEDAIERIPNLKELGIHYCDGVKEWSYYSLHNLGHLHKLESLSLSADEILTLKNIAFPHSLKKLTLRWCNIPWEEMTIIGSLPNLEVFELDYDAFRGPEWNPVEGEFLQLKSLLITSSDLVCWGAEKIHFPNLERLELCHMEYLEKIPSGIGEIDTLHLISLEHCTDSAVNSAKDILEEQHSSGLNEDLQLYVNCKLVRPDDVVDFAGISKGQIMYPLM